LEQLQKTLPMNKTTVLLTLFIGLAVPSQSDASRLVSLVSILADSQKFDAENVVVSGYVCKESGSDQAIFLTADDCRNRNFPNAIHYSGNFARLVGFEGLVVVEGKFTDWSQVLKTDENVSSGDLQIVGVQTLTKRKR
jgi:hypothetical protein